MNESSNSVMSRSQLIAILAIDGLMYLSLFWRDYSDHGQMLVAHYLSFVAITDLGALFLPASRRHWFNIFRFTSGISFLVLVGALAAKGLDGEALALTAIRVALVGTRILHAGWSLKTHGPGLQALQAFPSQVSEFYRKGTRSERWGCGYLLVGCGLLYFPQLAYWTHFNWGVGGLDDILTGLQGQAGLNFCIKLFVFEILVTGVAARLYMRSVVAVLFVAQWPAMPGMFYLAPLPVVHAIVEVYEIALVVLAYKAWKASKTDAAPSV